MQKQSMKLFCFPHSKSLGLVTKSQALPIDKADINKNWNSDHDLARFLWKKLIMLPNTNIKDNKMSLCSQHNCSGTAVYILGSL